MTAPQTASIFLVDDHPMVRGGLANLLRGAGFEIAGDAGNIEETLTHPGLLRSQLVIVDLALGEESGMRLIHKLREGGLPVLVYSMYESVHVIRQALDAGAGGYVIKREASGALMDAIQSVLTGTEFLSPRAERMLGMMSPSGILTGQQYQIYRLLGQGYSNDEISDQLGISIRTFESYSARIMDKLGVESMKDLRRQAIREATSLPPDF